MEHFHLNLFEIQLAFFHLNHLNVQKKEFQKNEKLKGIYKQSIDHQSIFFDLVEI
jgi:hypothetical protein